jgi:murein DD-endopeptidase MepM/ murein hydrolase activator NlpD
MYGGPRIMSTYGDFRGADRNYYRPFPHQGVDLSAFVGTPVLAAEDGTVEFVGTSGGCGINVFLEHTIGDPTERKHMYTRYCHLGKASVEVGQLVKRGDVIGSVGLTGETHPDFPHLHFELQKVLHANYYAGVEPSTQDPLPFIEGCFQAQKDYPTDRLVLTWPLKCTVR